MTELDGVRIAFREHVGDDHDLVARREILTLAENPRHWCLQSFAGWKKTKGATGLAAALLKWTGREFPPKADEPPAQNPRH